ncbi:thioredoxin family protein [Demequina pelophila]|uniref:thioredoxin family protein n=1 Tax=Demequina pelophila TaxID=1638984 RepID=UPI000780ED5A|nr:thioredoxin family protein [Demequina pelophila]
MDIAILGHGCKNCDTLEARTREVLAARGAQATVTHVTDDVEIAAAGVMRTPALVVDGTLVIAGQVPTVARLEELIPSS